jgi:hypothetical protein
MPPWLVQGLEEDGIEGEDVVQLETACLGSQIQ